MLKKIVIALALNVFISNLFYSWGNNGHRIVGDLAGRFISSKTKKSIRKILGNDLLALISTIPDSMRNSVEKFSWQNCTGQYKNNKVVKLNCKSTQIDWSKASTWHFLNTDIYRTFEEIENAIQVNAYQTIKSSFLILKNKNASIKEKVNAMIWLVHVVGDVHQPLHISNQSDHGGNEIKVKWFNKYVSLHSIWDSGLINFQDLSYSELSNFIFTKYNNFNEIKKIKNNCLIDWILDTGKLARIAYQSSNETYNSYRYNLKYMPIIKKQLFKAGVRLAFILNSIFDSNKKNNSFCISGK